MNSDVTTVRELLAGTGPAPSRQVLAAEPAEQFAMAVTLQTILTGEPANRSAGLTVPVRRSQRHRRARLVAAAAGARAATPAQLHYRPSGQPASVVLNRLAALAARQPVDRHPGRYAYRLISGWYLHTRVSDTSVTSAVGPTILETWIAADGSGQITEGLGAPLAASDATGPDGISSAAALPGDKHTTRYGAGQLAIPKLHRLSTNPDQLRRQLTPNSEIPDNVELLLAVSDLARQQPLTPALAAAANWALAATPGLRNDGAVTDRAGRAAIAIGIDSAYSGLRTTYQLLLDPNTGTVLGDEEVLREAGKLNVTTPAVISYSSILAGGTVTALGARMLVGHLVNRRPDDRQVSYGVLLNDPQRDAPPGAESSPR